MSFGIAESPSRLKEDLLDLIAGMQSRRMDEQRASLPRLPGLNNANADILRRLSSNAEVSAQESSALPDDNFFEMLMRCQVVIIIVFPLFLSFTLPSARL